MVSQNQKHLNENEIEEILDKNKENCMETESEDEDDEDDEDSDDSDDSEEMKPKK